MLMNEAYQAALNWLESDREQTKMRLDSVREEINSMPVVQEKDVSKRAERLATIFRLHRQEQSLRHRIENSQLTGKTQPPSGLSLFDC